MKLSQLSTSYLDYLAGKPEKIEEHRVQEGPGKKLRGRYKNKYFNRNTKLSLII